MWKIKFKDSNRLKKELRRLGKQELKQIKYSIDKLALTEDPKSLGKELRGDFSSYYSLRIKKYRVIFKTIDDELIILILKVGHRKDVYKKL